MIRVFGCSWSNYHLPKKIQTHWHRIIAKRLSLKTVNYAKSGDSNWGILSSLIKHSYKFQPEDIIIVNVTDRIRMEVSPGSNLVWFPNPKPGILVDPHGKANINITESFSKSYRNLISQYYETVFLPQQVEYRSFSPQIYEFLKGHVGRVSKIIVWDFEPVYLSIKNFRISDTDGHWNERGHEFLANIIEDCIVNNENKFVRENFLGKLPKDRFSFC
jgi:hypothetical protein